MNIIQQIFREYKQKRDSIDISIEKMKQELDKWINKIVLYGAGSAGIAFLHYLNDIDIYPVCFADGNSEKWGTICENIPVINYQKISEEIGTDALVIVTINTDGKKYCKSFAEELRVQGHEGVHKNLKAVGCKNVIDYTWFRRCRDLFRGDKYNLPSCSDVEYMLQHEEDIIKAYNLLWDDESKNIFEKIVYFRLINDNISIPTTPQNKQYFEYDLIPKKENEIFVDCGAFDGISLKTFLKENNNQFDYYVGLEPDNSNFKKLKKYVEELPEKLHKKMCVLENAAYSSHTVLNMYALNGPGSFISDTGETKVQSVKIDDIMKNIGATYIKMNIEGSELEALKGAKDIICNCMPRLAIAGYHKTRDLWEVPLLIYQLNSKYRFSLRSYMNHLSFVYYGI